MGIVAGRFGMETAFIVTALLALLTALVRPKEEVHSLGREASTGSGKHEGM